MMWFLRIIKKDPDRLLSLLIRAHRIDDNELQVSRIFRAGMKVGLNHPEIARNLLLGPEPEYQI